MSAQPFDDGDPFDIPVESAQYDHAPARDSKPEVQSPASTPGVANVDDLPHSLLGERTSIDQAEIEAAMATRPVTLFDAMRVVRGARAVPTLLAIEGAAGEQAFALYRGKSNWLSGESGQGKSTLAKKACRDEAIAGRASLFIDREKDIEDFAETMWDLGDVTDEQASLIFYWNPVLNTQVLMPTILGFIQKYGIDLVVVDSCSQDLQRWRHDFSENSNDNIRAWYNACIDPLVRFGATPFIIDHLAKPKQNAGGKDVQSESMYSMGATAKRAVVTGIALLLRSGTKFSKLQAGHAVATAAKVNRGAFTEGDVVFEFHVAPGEERSSFVVRAAEAGKPAGKFVARYTWYMERISELLQDTPDGLTGYAIQKHFKAIAKPGKNSAGYVTDALKALVEEGFVDASAPTGGRGAITNTHVKPYTEATDPVDNGDGAQF